jgi:hypothetical protein
VPVLRATDLVSPVPARPRRISVPGKAEDQAMSAAERLEAFASPYRQQLGLSSYTQIREYLARHGSPAERTEFGRLLREFVEAGEKEMATPNALEAAESATPTKGSPMTDINHTAHILADLDDDTVIVNGQQQPPETWERRSGDRLTTREVQIVSSATATDWQESVEVRRAWAKDAKETEAAIRELSGFLTQHIPDDISTVIDLRAKLLSAGDFDGLAKLHKLIDRVKAVEPK